MCGIFGYVGKKRNATSAVFYGLKRLDYRGYDSWGVGVIDNSQIKITKHVGVVNKKLLRLPKSHIAIGHTRWATTGGVTKVNAHPHFSNDKSFILAHNGVMENFEIVKKDLIKKGHKFISQTDTEVIVRLIEEELKTTKNLTTALRFAFGKCEGRNTVIILYRTGEVVAARNGSPLVLGFTEKYSEMYFSSDTLSFSPYVSKTITVENGELVVFKNRELSIYNSKNGHKVILEPQDTVLSEKETGKDNFKHYMLKEIHEQPQTILNVIHHTSETKIRNLAREIKKANKVYCIGSGTAGAAAFQIAYYLRFYSNINAIPLIGAEAKEYYSLFHKNDLIITPSQSGETADVLEVLEVAREKGLKIASFVNMPGSFMTAISDYKFMAHAGPEICVMSTKVFIAQLAWGYLLAKTVEGKYKSGIKNLRTLSLKTKGFLENTSVRRVIFSLSKKLLNKPDILLMGKGQNLQVAKEGMIKIIEGSYIHAHAISAGDLKHYAITLITKDFPVLTIVSNDILKADMLTAVNEVKARGAKIVMISSEKNDYADELIQVPETRETSAIINTVALQLLAYYLALAKGNNIDKPRNIAKSVTVK